MTKCTTPCLTTYACCLRMSREDKDTEQRTVASNNKKHDDKIRKRYLLRSPDAQLLQFEGTLC